MKLGFQVWHNFMEEIWEEHEIELGNQAFIGFIIIY
jgi:hypothetical protein